MLYWKFKIQHENWKGWKKNGMIIMTLLKLLSCIKEIINSEDSAPRHVIANFNGRGLKEGYSILTFKKSSGSYKKNRVL